VQSDRRGGEFAHGLRALAFLPRAFKANPDHDHGAAAHPDPPDYTSLGAWAAHPDRAAGSRLIEDANHAAVEGEDPPPPVDEREAACFFVHDTTYNPPEIAAVRSRHSVRAFWNAPVHPVPPAPLLGPGGHPSPAGVANLADKVDEMTELRCLVGGAPFADSCRVYAPRYRQANVLSFFNILKLPYVFDRRVRRRAPSFCGWARRRAKGGGCT